ncbi:MAG: family peptidase [Chloroflexi bacterium]|nr:family peptidase [Chloroflexota bacterium]
MITTRKDNVVDNFHGTEVADPYRWLEDAEAPEVLEWVGEQNKVTSKFLDAIPQKEAIKDRLTQLWDYPKFSAPVKYGNYYFFWKNDGLQNQSVLYRQESLDSEPELVVDPNKLSEDGTLALTSTTFTRDGSLMVYGRSQSGSDWEELKIKTIETKADFADTIRHTKFASVAWRSDKSGFFYNRFPDPSTVPPDETSFNGKVYWHSLNTDQSEDKLVYERPDYREMSFSPFATEDEKYLVMRVWVGTATQNRIYYRPMDSDGEFIRLLDEADARYDFIDNDGPVFFFNTDLDAPRGRIIAIDTNHPERENWKEILPEQSDVIDSVGVVNHKFVVSFLHNANHQVAIYSLDGQFERQIELPELGSVVQISGKRDDTEMFIGFTSFLRASTILRYNFTDGEVSVFRETELDFNPADYMTQQVFFASKDGTQVPMFLVHRKGINLNGQNPALLYAYGGFNISLTPAFSPARLAWLENGGVYALANIRGGGEFGESWHQGGMHGRKQNVFNDFIAAAEWLIENKYTNSSLLAIQGGSNGGLLVSACEVQRPDLYGAVICQVPVADMLRFHRFTVGRYWTSEYGNAENSPEEFKILYAYSPLHNVKPGVAYPPTLVLTADSDDRVVPLHAKKYFATLREAQQGDNPILLRIEMKAGHGHGKPTAKIIEEQSEIYAFLFKLFGMEVR